MSPQRGRQFVNKCHFVSAAVNQWLCTQLFPVCYKEEMAIVHEYQEHDSQAV